MTIQGRYCLQIDGWQYVPATQGVASFPTCTETDWVGSTGVTLLQGFLLPPRAQFSERVNPIDGELSVDQMTFGVFDADPGAGPASGSPVMTYSGTLNDSAYTKTQLSASCTKTDATIHVTDASLFAASGTMWLGQEAIVYAGTTGTTFTGCARGALGTLAVPHTVDAGNNYYPVVRSPFPSFEGRRVVLYVVDDAGVATPIWRGNCNRTPRFTRAADGRGSWGTVLEIQCEHAWQVVKKTRAAIAGATTHLAGFSTQAMSGYVSWAASPDTGMGIGGRVQDMTNPLFLKRSLMEALQNFTVVDTGYFGTNTLSVVYRFENGGVSKVVSGNVGSAFSVGFRLGSQTAMARSEGSGSGTAVANIPSAPPVLLMLTANDPGAIAPLMGPTTILPSTWTATTTADGTESTTYRPALVGDFSDDYYLVIEPTSVTAWNAGTQLGPFVVGNITLRAKSAAVPPARYITDHRPIYGTQLLIESIIPLNVSATVATTHWLLGVRHAFVEDTGNTMRCGIDSRDWEWSQQSELLRLTSDANSARSWIFDGSKTLGTLLFDELRYSGCAIGIRGSRLSPFAIRAPLPTDTIDTSHTFTSSDWIDTPGFERTPDGIANMAKVNAIKFAMLVRDQSSVDQYGPGRVVELDLPGMDSLRTAGSDPTQIWSNVLSRVIDLWGYPVFSGKFTVSLERFASVHIGDFVKVTDWLIPNGLGGRAPSNRKGMVIGKRWDLAAARIEFEVIFFDIGNIAGYAPCVRVTSIAGAVLSISNAYLTAASSTTDYAGSNLASYAFASTYANDAGVSWFAANDRVRLVKRGTVTATQETGLTVASIAPSTTPGASTITLTGAPATVVGTDEWDLVFDGYGNGSTPSANEKLFAWIASLSTGMIGTSTDRQTTWAP